MEFSPNTQLWYPATSLTQRRHNIDKNQFYVLDEETGVHKLCYSTGAQLRKFLPRISGSGSKEVPKAP